MTGFWGEATRPITSVSADALLPAPQLRGAALVGRWGSFVFTVG